MKNESKVELRECPGFGQVRLKRSELTGNTVFRQQSVPTSRAGLTVFLDRTRPYLGGIAEMDCQLGCRVLLNTNSKLVNIQARRRQADVKQSSSRRFFQREVSLLVGLC